MSNQKTQNTYNNKIFASFLGSIKNKSYLCTKKRRKDIKMDKRFTPRSNEEMLAAVRAFQARQKAFMERMDAKLEKEIYQEEMA